MRPGLGPRAHRPSHESSHHRSVSPIRPLMDQARLALIITLAIQSLAAWGMMAGPVLAPLAAKDIGVEPYLVGVYVSVAYAAAACAGLASGSFIARFGPLRLSQGCLALVGAALLLAVLGTPLALLVAAVVVGIGYGPITPASSQLLARTPPPARLNLVFSLKQTGVPIGNSLAGAILPSLGLVIGWRGAALVTAVLCFAVTAAAEPLRRPLDVDIDRERPLFSLGQLAGPLRLVLASPELRRLALTSFAYAGMQTSLTTSSSSSSTVRWGSLWSPPAWPSQRPRAPVSSAASFGDTSPIASSRRCGFWVCSASPCPSARSWSGASRRAGRLPPSSRCAAPSAAPRRPGMACSSRRLPSTLPKAAPAR